MVDISTSLGKVQLDNPVIPASGTFGFGLEMSQIYDIDILGSISVKGTTREARFGNPTPRIAECASGLINSVGLQNPGIDAVISHELPELRKVFHKPIIANISGFSVEEYAHCCSLIDREEQVEIIEVNISCPNVKQGGMAFGVTPEGASSVVKAVRAAYHKTLIVKLSPNVTDIVSIARAVEEAGADSVSLINTLLGMAIDAERRRPVLSTITGGLSGPAVKPVALRMVWQVAHAVSIPVVGLGGIMNGRDAIEFLLAGAKAVEVGTANFVDPSVTMRIVDEMEDYLRRHGMTSWDEVTML